MPLSFVGKKGVQVSRWCGGKVAAGVMAGHHRCFLDKETMRMAMHSQATSVF